VQVRVGYERILVDVPCRLSSYQTLLNFKLVAMEIILKNNVILNETSTNLVLFGHLQRYQVWAHGALCVLNFVVSVSVLWLRYHQAPAFLCPESSRSV